MKLRTMAVIALALVAGGAQAQDAGWDSKMGFIFGAGVDGNPLHSYNGMVGLQYNLSPQAALRVGLDLSRFSCGDMEASDSTDTVTLVCGGTAFGGLDPSLTALTPDGSVVGTTSVNSSFGLGLSAEYLMRATTAAVSPYYGAGLFLGFESGSLKGEDKFDAANSPFYKYNNKASEFNFGLLGKAGVEWRLNKVIAVFAEYELGINIINSSKSTVDETDGVADPTTPVAVEFETKQSNVFNLGTGISNSGFVGVTAFF